MGEQDFLGLNLIALLGIGLLVFVYLVLLIRKRWKNDFLHERTDKPSKT